MANLGDVAISLGPVVVTAAGAWVALHYGRKNVRDQLEADERRAAVQRHYIERDQRQAYYHDALTLLARFRDAAMCRPRFPVQELREWRADWRRTSSGVTITGSPACRRAIAALDVIVLDIHQHWYEKFGMPPDSFIPQQPLADTGGGLFAHFREAAEELENAMRSDLGSSPQPVSSSGTE